MSEDQKECFVIMPISDAEGYDKGHFTRVYYDIIKPAVESAGHKPIRADEVVSSNLIQLAYIIHSGFISGYQNRYGDNLKPPTNVYHRMTA